MSTYLNPQSFSLIIKALAANPTTDIVNSISTVLRNIDDIVNLVSTVNGTVDDITNDMRSRGLGLSDIVNDCRFLSLNQVPGLAGIESLGKSAIKVYIGGVLQSDVDVDSINISKGLNTAHTANFNLGQAYDTTKPAMESTVTVYYDNWLLYSGYIHSISPTGSPESIKISCSDLYWKNNRTNKYFYVGNKPDDATETYYDTIKAALSAEFSWSVNIGDFVPQLMNEYGVGQSDAVSALVANAGNYQWYYDELGNRVLWTAGLGTIITLDKQVVGTNIGLYQVLGHNFNDDITGIVNKLRVEMGEKSYQGGELFPYLTMGNSNTQVNVQANPSWGWSLEQMAGAVGTYGWDYPGPYKKTYKDVFKKYEFSVPDQVDDEWSDEDAPTITIDYPGWGAWSLSVPLDVGIPLTEGFTIALKGKDKKTGTLSFSERVYFKQLDYRGEISAVTRANIRVTMVKKKFWRQNPAYDPETYDPQNKLVLITDKIGTYPTTIFGILPLSSLSIQIGGYYLNSDGTWSWFPSWDDTDFAYDLAYWSLSKTSEKKVSGTAEITIDNYCFKNIGLSSRIDIPGIVDNALDITGINIAVGKFTATLTLASGTEYRRTVSLQSRGS